jgi:hypothetical protein
MTDGLPISEFVSFEDAKQFVACGQARSLHPTWRTEKELALAPVIEEWAREVQAAAADERGYPVPPVEVGMSAASIVATLFPHRADLPAPGRALLDAAIAAAAAGAKKDEQLLDASRRLIRAFEASELALYGLRVGARSPRLERIDPHVTAIGQEGESVTVDIEIRDDTMYPDPRSPWSRGVAPGPLYEAVCMEHRAFVDWAGRSGTPNTGAEEAPPSDEVILASSLEGPPASLADQEVHSNLQTSADPEQVPPNAKASAREYPADKRRFFRSAFDEMFPPDGVPQRGPGRSYKALYDQIIEERWDKNDGDPPDIKTFHRAKADAKQDAEQKALGT